MDKEAAENQEAEEPVEAAAVEVLEVIQEVEQPLKADQNDPTLVFDRMTVYINWEFGSNPETALANIDKELKKDKQNASLWFQKGAIYQNKSEIAFQQDGKYDLELSEKAMKLYL